MKTMMLLALLAQASPKAEADLKKAEAVLAEKPDDTRANQTVGQYHLAYGDPEKAIAYLAKASERTLKEAAEAEGKADPVNAVSLVEIGDLWVKAMLKNKALRQPCFDRANHWYGKAWEGLDDAGKQKLRPQLDRLYTPIVPGKATKGAPAGWGGGVPAGGEVEVSNRKVRSGGSALRLAVRKEGVTFAAQSPRIAVRPGQKIEVSVWLLTDGTRGAGDRAVFVMSSDSGKGVWTHSKGLREDQPYWTQVKAETVAPDEAFSLRLDVWVGSTVGSLWVDDVSIKVDGKEMIPGGVE